MGRKRRRVRTNCPVGESTIHTWVGESQFNRGLKYVELDLVGNPQRRGAVIHALCSGKQAETKPYEVSATVIGGKIITANCSCSIGKYGVCPHIAATLILYSRRPEAFEVVTFFGRLKRVLGL